MIALDGVDRKLLYDMLRAGELPGLASLLGGREADGRFAHAHFDETLLSVLPSCTLTAWAATPRQPAVADLMIRLRLGPVGPP